MRTLERNEKIIYHSKRHVTDDGVTYYDIPVALRCNPMPIRVDWNRVEKGEVTSGMKKFLLSRDVLRETLSFNPYGYDHAIYGIDEDTPYGWVESYLTRWLNDLDYGDRFYVDASVPDDYTGSNMAEGADYVVVGIEDTPNFIGIILKRLTV